MVGVLAERFRGLVRVACPFPTPSPHFCLVFRFLVDGELCLVWSGRDGILGVMRCIVLVWGVVGRARLAVVQEALALPVWSQWHTPCVFSFCLVLLGQCPFCHFGCVCVPLVRWEMGQSVMTTSPTRLVLHMVLDLCGAVLGRAGFGFRVPCWQF